MRTRIAKTKNGYVITFGKIMCSASMNINAIVTATNIKPTGSNGSNPICQKTSTKLNAVRSSTAGYRNEIGPLQFLHFPPSSSQLKIGILS